MMRIQHSLFTLTTLCLLAAGCGSESGAEEVIRIKSSNFFPGNNMTARSDSAHKLRFVIQEREKIPFNQSAVKQTTAQAAYGPSDADPYFHVRFALPIPPTYSETEVADLTGIDEGVFHHNHSPGFEILPNGDALAIYFSTPCGLPESDTATTFIQSRLRYGAEEWDMPELFFSTSGGNDQSGLLWNDNGKIWFFGGGRHISDYVPFRIATSDDNGASWTFSVPILNEPATDYTAQPIADAFRAPDGSIYMAMDGKGSESYLWQSADNGTTWRDMQGRTGGRHSTIVPLDNDGTLLSIGGKNSNVDGWAPFNISKDWGATWSTNEASAFPALGNVQRPSIIRLASGNLVYVSDSYQHKNKIAPPAGWDYGNEAFVALSSDNGKTWHIKTLPVQLPQRHRLDHGSLGYVTARQAPNGVIHVLTTANYPPLHYEFNEAWILSDAGDISPESSDGTVEKFTEFYPEGELKSVWTARITPAGRYLLEGKQTDYYQNGAKQYEVVYANGRKTGVESFWSENGTVEWTWQRDLDSNRGIWTQYWPNGNRKVESHWDIRPQARDLKRNFYGYVADGIAQQWDENGYLTTSSVFVKGILKE